MKKYLALTLSLILLMLAGCSRSAKLDDKKVQNLYNAAYEAMEWFEMPSLSSLESVVFEDVKIDRYGTTYTRVEDKRFKTFQDFQDALSALFTAEKVDSLLALPNENWRPMFREFDGALYRVLGDRGSRQNVGAGETLKWAYTDDETVTVTVTYPIVKYVDREAEVVRYESVDMTLKKVDGQWLWADFQLIR
ncbi:hypothetical protein ACR6HW_04415 [Fusibacter sp. JL298sf-3]